MVFWVFGYGSLVWNPGFEYDEKVIGYIKNYKRVFDLGKCLCNGGLNNKVTVLILACMLMFVWYVSACIDHRGTPEHPARTCTLEYAEGAICVSVYSNICYGFCITAYLCLM